MNVSIRIYSFLLVNKHTKFEDRSFIPIHILLFSALAILLQLIQLSSTAEQATLHTQVSLLPTARQLSVSIFLFFGEMLNLYSLSFWEILNLCSLSFWEILNLYSLSFWERVGVRASIKRKPNVMLESTPI